jgi:hypothetical protein
MTTQKGPGPCYDCVNCSDWQQWLTLSSDHLLIDVVRTRDQHTVRAALSSTPIPTKSIAREVIVCASAAHPGFYRFSVHWREPPQSRPGSVDLHRQAARSPVQHGVGCSAFYHLMLRRVNTASGEAGLQTVFMDNQQARVEPPKGIMVILLGVVRALLRDWTRLASADLFGKLLVNEIGPTLSNASHMQRENGIGS